MTDLLTLNLQQLFGGRIFQIPNYQRGYAWEEPQLQDLLDDLDELPDGREHFTGMIVLQHTDRPSVVDISGDEHSVLDVVDGQQRLTTLVLLLDAIRREALSASDLGELAVGIKSRYLFITDQSRQLATKLRFLDGTQEYFERHTLADSPAPGGPETPSQRRIMEAAAFLRDHLKKHSPEDAGQRATWLLGLHTKIAHRLKLNLYEVADSAESGVIFEVMNNRGRPLSDLDLVKNYVLYLGTKLDLEVATNLLVDDVASAWAKIFTNLTNAELDDSEYENQLLRTHWLVGYDSDAREWHGRKSVKDYFALRAYEDQHDELLAGLRAFVQTLADTSLAYADIHRPIRDGAFQEYAGQPKIRAEIVELSDCLVRLEHVAPFRPLLVATRLRLGGDAQKYLEVLRLCEIYAFRIYGLFEKRSNTGQSTLFSLAGKLWDEELSFEELLRQFAGTLLSYVSQKDFLAAWDMPELGEDPDEWYGWRGCKYLLFEYERHFVGQDDLGTRWSAKLKADRQKTIEHILPQTPDDPYWVKHFTSEEVEHYGHSLGNLCLTEDNSSYGKRSFTEKRGTPGQTTPCYANAPLKSERELAQYDQCGPAEVLERRAELVAWAIERWALPVGLEAVEPTSVKSADDELVEEVV